LIVLTFISLFSLTTGCFDFFDSGSVSHEAHSEDSERKPFQNQSSSF
jgi:hypothetical protein